MPIQRSGYAVSGAAKQQQYGWKSRHWKIIRAQRLNLDSHRCRLQLEGCTTTATTVHLDPRLNGNHSLATLMNTLSACRHCHGVLDGAGARTF